MSYELFRVALQTGVSHLTALSFLIKVFKEATNWSYQQITSAFELTPSF